METPINTDKKNYVKPAWLSKLEDESWQAELLISGAAIFGTLQLPGLVGNFEDWILYTLNRESLFYWMMVGMFLRILSYVLIATFIYHFAMRALWIGLIGFNSAYPGGFKPNKRYSEDFQEKLKEEFGDIDGYIQELDRSCSSIFGSGFALALVCTGCSTLLIALGLFFYWLRDYLDPSVITIIGLVLYVLIMGISLFSMIMAMPRFHDKEWVKRIHWPLTKGMGKIMYSIAYRPANIILNLITSHNADKSNQWVSMLIGATAFGFIGFFTAYFSTRAPFYNDDYYHRYAEDTTRLNPNFYADTKCEDCQVYHPVIPSQRINDPAMMQVFLPLPNREWYVLQDQCSFPEVADSLSKDEGRKLRRLRTINCAREYFSFSLNNQALTDFQLQRHNLVSNDQYGMVATLTDLSLQRGQNLLEITSKYPDEDGEDRIARIPFYYFPDETAKMLPED